MDETDQLPEDEHSYQSEKDEMLKKSRFSPKIESFLRLRKYENAYPDLPREPRPFELGRTEKFRQLLGKQIDPDLFQWVAERVKEEEARERAWDDFLTERISYDNFKTIAGKLLESREKGDGITYLCDLAIEAKDAEFFRALGEILEFVRKEGIPNLSEYERVPREEWQFLQVWILLEEACRNHSEDVFGRFRLKEEFIELKHRFPSLNDLWLLGCDHYGWAKGRWESEEKSEKMKDRLRKFLERRGLPYRKSPR